MLFVLSLTLSACASFASFSVGLSGQSRGVETISVERIGGFRNNSTVQLEAGSYRGNLVIDANSVTLNGARTERTFITGNVTITGNNAVLKNLRVNGNVRMEGNNNDISAARVDGRIISVGQNNK